MYELILADCALSYSAGTEKASLEHRLLSHETWIKELMISDDTQRSLQHMPNCSNAPFATKVRVEYRSRLSNES